MPLLAPIFRSIFLAADAVSALTTVARIDDRLGDPEVHAAARQLSRGDFVAAEQFVKSARDAEEREFIISRIVPKQGRAPFIERWVESAPNSSIAHCVAGYAAIVSAWNARGSGWAHTVKDWGGFFDNLQLAETRLATAARLEPRDATPWAYLAITARGLQKDPAEVDRCFDESQRRAKYLLAGIDAMVQRKATKWGGQPGELRRFAAEVASRVPDGHPALSVVPMCVFEEWLVSGSSDGMTLLQSPSNLPWVTDASARLLAGRSAAKRHRCESLFHSYFAAYFSVAELDDRARPHLELMGRYAPEFPWAYLAAPLRAFIDARKAAGL